MVDVQAQIDSVTRALRTGEVDGAVIATLFAEMVTPFARELDERGIPYVVAEQNREVVEDLRKIGKAAVSGNAADPAVLIQAHIADAAMLVVATPDALDVRLMADTARTLNPGIEIVIRTQSEDESLLLRKEEIGTVFLGEDELAKGMASHVLQRFAPQETGTASEHG